MKTNGTAIIFFDFGLNDIHLLLSQNFIQKTVDFPGNTCTCHSGHDEYSTFNYTRDRRYGINLKILYIHRCNKIGPSKYPSIYPGSISFQPVNKS